jgi:hypothetical protein
MSKIAKAEVSEMIAKCLMIHFMFEIAIPVPFERELGGRWEEREF